jgi:hypothetical protein
LMPLLPASPCPAAPALSRIMSTGSKPSRGRCRGGPPSNSSAPGSSRSCDLHLVGGRCAARPGPRRARAVGEDAERLAVLGGLWLASGGGCCSQCGEDGSLCLRAEDVAAALSGSRQAVEARAGWGSWAVLRRGARRDSGVPDAVWPLRRLERPCRHLSRCRSFADAVFAVQRLAPRCMIMGVAEGSGGVVCALRGCAGLTADRCLGLCPSWG